MNRRERLTVIAGILSLCLVLLALYPALYPSNESKPAPYRTVYDARSIHGQQTFMVGPDICNLTWSLNLSHIDDQYYNERVKGYLSVRSYTTLYHANISLVLREVGHTESNVTQTIFIEPKVEPLGSMVRDGTRFQLLWDGNITTRYDNFWDNANVWSLPTLTFNMPYYVLNTTIAGEYSCGIGKSFTTPC